ncbi:SusD/RagB family nutrient-binding outer membrane lipoprotein [Halalkalibaculum sp. DA3122]
MGLLSFFTSCDAGFDSMNVDETAVNELEPMTILNDQIQLTPSSGIYGHLLYDAAIVQQMIAPYGQTLAGGNFNQDNQFPWVIDYFDDDYSIISHAVDVIENTRDDDFYHNAHQKARIWKAFVGLLATDTIGDAPYSEAGLGYHEGVLNPSYDTQESIYESALQEIQQATEALDPNSRIETNDILYAGDITKWKRFGYSLLLRYGMRLSEIAPGTAQQYVQAAYNGGVFQSNEDNAIIVRNDNYNFSLSGTFNGGERHNFYLTEVFVDYMKENDDPRLRSIAVRYVGATGIGDQDERLNRSTDPADQIGMPLGHDQTTIHDQAASDGLESMWDYSQVDRDRMVSQTAPDFLITYAQTQLLLAEAAERNWISGPAVDFFTEGVRAHLEQMEQHHPDMAIPQSEIDDYVSEQEQAYLAENPYEHIHNQYWVAGFIINPREVFSNWRRTGYPQLDPNPYPDQEISGDFIRRRKYVEREIAVNADNVRSAIERQGWSGNNLDARVWWDTESYNPN